MTCTIYSLEELLSIKGGKRLPTGGVLTKHRTNHPYIRIRDLGPKNLELSESFEFVPEDIQKKIAQYVVAENDIVISIVGTIGLISMIGPSLNNANLTENCAKLTNLDPRIDSQYLYYFLKSTNGQDQISQLTVGAVQPKLPLKNIGKIEIPCPPLEKQRQISFVLSSLDRKIELNNQINDYLAQFNFSRQ